MLTRLIQGEADGERLTEPELLQNCIFILNAGHETTTNLIGNGLVALQEWPRRKARLIAEPGLISTAVEEFLRFESSNQLGNRITTRLPDRRRRLPAGTSSLSASAPPTAIRTHFADPERLDVGRGRTATSPSAPVFTNAPA